MRCLFGTDAVADGLLLPQLSDKRGALAPNTWPLGLFCMSPSDIRDGWYDYGENTNPINHLV